jgi:hypothetical protein
VHRRIGVAIETVAEHYVIADDHAVEAGVLGVASEIDESEAVGPVAIGVRLQTQREAELSSVIRGHAEPP